jgi:chromosome partitioning protein
VAWAGSLKPDCSRAYPTPIVTSPGSAALHVSCGRMRAYLHGRITACCYAAMHVIGVTSRKGGVGKTTLTAHLSVVAEAAGIGRVAVIDTDPQGGLAGWWNARQAEAPAWIDPTTGLPSAVTAARAAGYGLLLIDTPPSLTAAISDVLKVADLIVIPVQPSPNDLRAVGGTIDLVKRARRRMVFVINRATQRARITAEAAILLSQYGTVAPVMVHSRVDFATSMTDGRTAGELDAASRSAVEMVELWRYLHSILTEDDGHAESQADAAE